MTTWYRVLFMASITLLVAATAQAQALRIGAWDEKSDQLVMVSEAVLAQAYAKLGVPVVFVDMPVRRALVLMQSGELDGNVHRVAELLADQPTLARVETPINATAVRAYSRHKDIHLKGWSDLDGLRVAYVRGTLLVERGLTPQTRRVEAANIEEMLRLLTKDMADVALFVEPASSPVHPLAAAAQVERLAGVIQRVPLHHYLVGKHREMALRLDGVLQAMQRNGELQGIQQRALKARP